MQRHSLVHALRLLALGGLATTIAFAQTAAVDRYPVEKWAPFATYGAGAQIAVMHLGANRTGLLVARMMYPPNFKLAPHTHNVDYVVTVLSGTYYSGTGDRYDAASMRALGPGATVIEPAGVPHYAETRGEGVVLHISGTEPASTQFVNPADDPRKK